MTAITRARAGAGRRFFSLAITATLSPAAYSYTSGDRIDSHPDFATLDATGNYSSTTSGTIQSVEWLVDGIDRAGSFTVSAGEQVVLRVTDGAANTRDWTIDADVAGIAPSITASDDLSGRTLTITVLNLTGDPTPTVSLTTLTLDGVDVLGDETGAGPWEYVVPDSAASQTVAWEVTGINSEGSDTASGSEIVAANFFAPTNDVAPSIAGDTGLGDTLTVTAGTWSGNPTPTLSYQWRRDGLPIAGETGTTYEITLADSGADISVVETATNSSGSASEASNAITADIFTAPVNTAAPSISGTPEVGETLTRTAGTWTGNPIPTIIGQWQRDSVDITGETGATYGVVSVDQGADITYLETATNALDTVTQPSNAIAIPAATVPDAFTAPDWDVTNGGGGAVNVNILTLPDDGGEPLTDIEYRVNNGTAVSLGETTTGIYPITADEGDDTQIRTVNAIGAADWSDVKVAPAGTIPLSLFAFGEQGVWYDPSDLSTLFQDSAGTTPVTVDGDPSGRILDKSGNMLHADQAISARRPIYNTDGTLHWLEGDGTDDNISSPQSLDYSNAAEFWMFAAAQRISKSFAISLNGDDFQYLRIEDNKIFARPETGTANGASLAVASWSASPVVWLIRVRQSDRSVTVFRDGVNVGDFSLPGSDWWPSLMHMTLFAAQPDNVEAAFKIYQAGTIAKALSQNEQDNLTQFLAEKAGVTL